jgi:HemY protein
MDRLKRMRRLAELRPNHPEGAMAVARAAIDAHDWEAARAALEGPARSQPSERVCVLMAEIEQNQYGDEGRVRSWLARAINAPRDPAWVADGRIFQHWAPISPISGRIDAFEWKVPSEPTSEPRMPLIDLGPDLTLPAVAAALAEPQEVTGTEQADTSTADGPDEPDVVDIAPMKSGEVAEVSAESEDKGEVEGNDDKGKESEVAAAPTPVEPASQPTASDEAPPEQQTEADESPSARPTDDETPSTRPAVADGDAVSPAATTSEKAESSAPLAESPTPTAEQPDAEESVKPVVPPIPDDPGPEPRDESETPRRFRLFGSSA